MNNCHISILTTILLAALTALGLAATADIMSIVGHQPGGPQEYCLSEENFITKCLRHEVVVMHSALYGRMKIGRCLEGEEFSSDPRVIGCSVDVLHLMDRKCSGRNWCEINRLTELMDIKRERPCNKGLESYLEVEYECVPVVEEDKSCIVSASSNPLHIMRSTLSSSKLSCGTKSQPWKLEAPAGQQIMISLLDFGPKNGVLFHQQSNNCQQYGYIFDKVGQKNVSVCGLVRERNKLVYKSSSNVAEVVLNSATAPEDITFLLQVMAVGCSEIVPPIDAWLRRTEDGAVVGCYSSRQIWYLRCIQNNWIGVIGNCTRDNEIQRDHDATLPQAKSATIDNHQLLVIVALTLLAVIICATIICCGAVLLRRYYATAARKQWRKIEEIENLKRFNGTASANPISMNGRVDI